jgi:transposase
VPATEETRKFYGATYLLDSIGNQIGIAKDLKICFPKTYKQILSLAYYLIIEPESPLYRFEKWGILHKHPYGKNISSQRVTELFTDISEEAKNNFFRLQGKRRSETEHLAYDTTSISNYSELLKQVQYGKNKENDDLPQLNLALVFGEDSNLPFYYRKIPGNIHDSTTVANLLTDFEELGFSKVKFVMDRGFYSKDNINDLYKRHVKFLMAAKKSTLVIRNEIDKIYDEIKHFDYYVDDYGLYAKTIRTEWDYAQTLPRKGTTINEKRRFYVHVYYDRSKAAEDEMKLDKKLSALRKEIETEKRESSHQKQYDKYFNIKSTPKRGTQAIVKNEVMELEKKYAGFFTLISNEAGEAVKSLEIYRNKDVVEKAFENLKDRLEMRRIRVHSERALDGKLFVQFIALIYLSYIKKQMQIQGLFKKYTMQEVIDKLDIIECFERPGKSIRIGEVTKKQNEIFTNFGIKSLNT